MRGKETIMFPLMPPIDRKMCAILLAFQVTTVT